MQRKYTVYLFTFLHFNCLTIVSVGSYPRTLNFDRLPSRVPVTGSFKRKLKVNYSEDTACRKKIVQNLRGILAFYQIPSGKMDLSNSSTPSGILASSTMQTLPEENGPAVQGIGVFIMIVGICGNGFVVFMYLKSNVLRSALNKTPMKAVMSLAITDLLTIACLGCTGILFMLEVDLPYHVCLISVAFPIYMTFVTQFVLGITMFERYLAICNQHKYQKWMTNRSFNVLLAFACILPLFLTIVPSFGYNYWNELQTCFLRYIYHEWIFICQSISFVTVMVITISLYVPILFKAKEFHKKTYPAQLQGVNSRTARLKAKQRALRYSILIGVLTIAFMLCNLPLAIVRFLFGIGYSIGNTAFNVTMLLGTMVSVVNPFLYAFQQQLFCQETLKFIGCRWSKTVNIDRLASMERQVPHTLVPPRHPQSCENNTSYREWNREIEPITISQNAYACTSSVNTRSNVVKTEKIHVQPYRSSQTAETSL